MSSDIDMIATAFGMLFTMVALCVGGYFVYKKYFAEFAENKRPQSKLADKESKIISALENLINKIPGLDPKDQDLSKLQGDWFTAAPFPLIWETVLKGFKDGTMCNPQDDRNNWRVTNVYDHLRQFRASAAYDHEYTLVSAAQGISDQHVRNRCTITVTLTFHPLESGGTRVNFHYVSKGIDSGGFVGRIVPATNNSLRFICQNLSIDSGRATM
ncbi:MAG: hypothetical protein K2X81_24530 [Candidatus Obscuribacterales bacterium]|nr:hypothetical protein [Candidatus Obscuribacterales bacterium]